VRRLVPQLSVLFMHSFGLYVHTFVENGVPRGSLCGTPFSVRVGAYEHPCDGGPSDYGLQYIY
jgi:hypothetical protein